MEKLFPHQIEAIENLDNGKILYGNVGTGKSVAVMGYYIKNEAPRDVYIITPAKKRDSLEWERDAAYFGVGTEPNGTVAGLLTVDSWNNIHKYTKVEDAFFIFDEQRVVSNGAWVRAFLKIAKKNRWVLLTATPGDTWLDYAPVFVANGLYDNLTQFKREHVVYHPYVRFPRVMRYLGVETLEKYRNMLLVEMPFAKVARREIDWLEVDYDHELFKRAVKHRWNVFENRPIRDIGELFRVMRRIVNSDESRLRALRAVLKSHPKVVVFYNFDYELEILRGLKSEIVVAEWNGHKKEQIPDSEAWIYLVQYSAGAEGWNCTDTDTMVFFSLTYSYKNFYQAQGRIDRLNSPFIVLYYYVFWSDSIIDNALRSNLAAKKLFNERVFYEKIEREIASELGK